ncbi:MAG TPA: DUF1588 domain-containing protein, partial [Pseudobdellovibrionaceae bacterium]|nr:DUF1588 domain-containing protein [Pseudobdellovibrionaceae bacterium]
VTGTSGLRGVRVPAKMDYSKFRTQRLAAYSTAVSDIDGHQYPYVNETRLLLGALSYAKNAAGTAYVSQGYSTVVVPDSNITDVGELIGITASTPFFLRNFYGGFSLADTTAQRKADRLAAADLTFSVNNFRTNAHMGGGIIGSPAFLMSNMNLGVNQFPDGVTLINRRLSSRVFEDLLCHQMPTLTEADVAGETNALKSQGTPHTFQQSTSCMRCHSGIDGMGYGMRNLMLFQTGGNPAFVTQEYGLRMTGVMKLPTLANSTVFALQAPSGRLHYRENITKTRVNTTTSSLQDLGNKLAANNDIYYCTAKRYYYFLTGINVDITQAPANKLDSTHYNQIKLLGDAFKTSQSVRTLIDKIIQTPAFRTWNYKSTEEQ